MSPPTAEFQLQLKPVTPGIPQCSVPPAESCSSPVPCCGRGVWGPCCALGQLRGRTGSRAHPSWVTLPCPAVGTSTSCPGGDRDVPLPLPWGSPGTGDSLLCRADGEGCRQPWGVVCMQSWGVLETSHPSMSCSESLILGLTSCQINTESPI